MKKHSIIFFLSIISLSLKAQIQKTVAWSYAAKQTSKTEAIVYLKATIDNGWHIYSSNQKEGGPVKTSFKFSLSNDYTLVGMLTEPKPVTRYEDVFEMDISYFEKSVIFQQRIKLKKILNKFMGDTGTSPVQALVKGSVEFMACTDKQCLPAETVTFSIPINLPKLL
nr:protein-disulfide reductase DsbD domain-containing protein [Pedobacter panaciterrae]